MAVGMGLECLGTKGAASPLRGFEFFLSSSTRIFSPVSCSEAKTGGSTRGCCDGRFVPSVAFVTANSACFSTLAGTVTWVDSVAFLNSQRPCVFDERSSNVEPLSGLGSPRFVEPPCTAEPPSPSDSPGPTGLPRPAGSPGLTDLPCCSFP